MNPRITSQIRRAQAVLRRVIAGAAALALVAACSSGESNTSADADGEPGYAAALQTSLTQVVKETTVPSAIVVVRSGQFGDATFSFGARSLGGTEPVAPSDAARIGSVTKTMTATIILQLVQEGRLALDDPVSKYVPQVPDGDNITIAQLLEMRSGLNSYTGDVGFLRAIADRQRVWRPEELLDIAFAEPADFAPGSDFGYSNTNYILLGMIIERLTGQSLTDVFTQRLFTPLGMRATVLPALDDASMPVPFVHGYQYGSFEKASSTDPALPAEQQAQAAAGTLRPDDWSEYNPSWGWAAGSVISTPEDLVLWAEALVGGTLLDPATQRMRIASIKGLGPAHPEAAGYGYGYGIQKQQSYYGHSGTIAGYNTEVLRDPDTDTTIVVVATLTVAPDGTPVAPALASAVINALP